MATPNESRILKIIEAEGGKCTVGRIAARMRLGPSYVRIILRAMGEAGMINVSRFGKITMAGPGRPKAARGYRRLKKIDGKVARKKRKKRRKI